MHRPCIVPGCAVLVSKGSRCPRHRIKKTPRLNGWERQRIRDKVLERDGNRCVKCGGTDGLQVHHLDGWKAGDPLGRLVTLCAEHHLEAHGGAFQNPPQGGGGITTGRNPGGLRSTARFRPNPDNFFRGVG
jgi:hypothetical protein